MCIFLLPRTMINKIEKKLNSYRRGHKIEKKRYALILGSDLLYTKTLVVLVLKTIKPSV